MEARKRGVSQVSGEKGEWVDERMRRETEWMRRERVDGDRVDEKREWMETEWMRERVDERESG